MLATEVQSVLTRNTFLAKIGNRSVEVSRSQKNGWLGGSDACYRGTEQGGLKMAKVEISKLSSKVVANSQI